MTERRKAPKKDAYGDAAYNEPNHRCATCGRPTSSKRMDAKAGFGDFHYDCRRDETGHLIVSEE